MMQPIHGSPVGLYRRLLGAAWDDLGEAVRQPHGGGEMVRGAGRFRLEVREGALVYHSAGAALRLGPLTLPLPRWGAPRISASEAPLDGGDRTQVSVESRAPLLGLLIAYEGTVTRIEDGS